MTDAPLPRTLTLQPIGVVHSPHRERLSAPRQPRLPGGAPAILELFPASGIEYALSDLAAFRFIWVVFWFHENQTFRPKVLPPRSPRKRGVFATRSPYRPNPIGLSAVELVRIEGLKLHLGNVDMLDQTPVLDIKPYVPYTDCISQANSGWLDERALDPVPGYGVAFAERALCQLQYLEARDVVLRPHIERVLELGPEPHAYRRIKRVGKALVVAYKAWRCKFTVEGRDITVSELWSGYKPSVLAKPENDELALHRSFMDHFFPQA